MGVHLPNGYHITVPSLQLVGSTHTFQVAMMAKTKVGDNVAATNTSWIDALTLQTNSPLKSSNIYVGWNVLSIKTSQMDSGLLTVVDTVSSIIGTKAASLGVPCNVSILTKKPVDIAGRKYRGRCMWPDLWVSEANIGQNGVIDSTGITLVNTLMAGMDARLVGLGIFQYLGHSSSEVAPTALNGPMLCVPKVGTIKRRIRGSS
jgi:hypothetical protein